MFWKAGDKVLIENLDNHLSAIDMAKDELRETHEIIVSLKNQADLIKAGNSMAIKEALAKIAKDEEEVMALKKCLLVTQQKALDQCNALEVGIEMLNSKNSDFNELRSKHLTEIANQKYDLSQREALINKDKDENQVKSAELQALENELGSRHYDLEIKNKNVDDAYEMAILARKEADDKLCAANKAKEHAEGLHDQIAKKHAEHDEQIQLITASLEESRKNKADAEEVLNLTFKEKERIRDLIIQSKQSKLDADNSIELAKRLFVETNHKIAELNALKDALAKQEK